MQQFTEMPRLLSTINAIGLNTSTQGCNRPAYTAAEVQAITVVRDLILSEARDRNILNYIQALQDDAGNVYITTSFPEPDQFIFTGSHLDTVPEGGKFDGALGVALGAAAVIDALHYYATGGQLRFNVCLCIWRAEESACWRKALLGSSLAFGRLHSAGVNFQTVFGGVSLEDAIDRYGAIQGFESNGVSSARIKEALSKQEPVLPRFFDGKIAGFVEFHSAQGPIPGNTQLAIINRGIRGTCRPEFVYASEDDDRVLADLILSKESAVLGMEPDAAVLTFGVVNATSERYRALASELAVSKVPPRAEVVIDAIVEYDSVSEIIKEVCGIHGTEAHIEHADGCSVVVVTGEAAHSGATPNGPKHRRDANLAACSIISALAASVPFRNCRLYLNRLPGERECRIFADLRSTNHRLLTDFGSQLIDDLHRITKVAPRINTSKPVEPSAFDNEFARKCAEILSEAAASSCETFSGAGHDIMNPLLGGIPGVLVFIRDNQVSHNPAEYVSEEDLEAGFAANRRLFAELLLS